MTTIRICGPLLIILFEVLMNYEQFTRASNIIKLIVTIFYLLLP